MSDPYRTPGRIEEDVDMGRNWGEFATVVFWGTLLISLALGCSAVVVYPLFRVMTASGVADYCYVEPEVYYVDDPKSGNHCGTTTRGYTLKQHVPWGSDRALAKQIPTSEDVRKEAEAFKCTLR